MQKTITVKMHELRQNLLKVVNESELPSCCIEPIVSELLGAVKESHMRQLQSDLDNMNKGEE